MRTTRRMATIVAGMATIAALVAAPARAATTIDPYAEGRNGYETVALFSVDDSVPRTGDPAQSYRMVGIPDGLGIVGRNDGAVLYMNHEFTRSTVSQPVPGGPEYRGAIVSAFRLDDDGDPVSGDLAYRRVFQNAQLVGPIATTANATSAFARFCSGFLAGTDVGFDRPIYLAGEEAEGADTFDGKGGQSVAIVDNKAYALSRLGHFSKENQIVQPNEGLRTVIFPLEDGPSTPDSQLYMYVGRKNLDATGVLARNGLNNGKLYVFVSDTAGKSDEASFTGGEIAGHWELIPRAKDLTDAELESASDAAGAFAFVRIEDGAFSPSSADDMFFVTTGGNAAAGNDLGRGYHLKLDPQDPLGTARLAVVYNADSIVANGGDAPLSPDNVDAGSNALMIQEDGTASSRPVFASKDREGAIWRFALAVGTLRTSVKPGSRIIVAELTPPGRDDVPVPIPGTWETSGIIDTAGVFGRNTWLFDVQAHAPTTAPSAGTVEDGQLLMLRRA
jgi:hypothetical protein